ncbi:MAG TPA: MFS transporter [Dehalococcoidia bacterium]|nr:MFS transporter [Dehalococcoidia bacterium]
MKYKWVALTVTTVAGFMASLDSTIVVIGLPTILQDLHATLVHGIWIITGYQLTMTILLIMVGRLSDLYGRVRLYNIGFAVFTVGSACCALSRTGEQLVLFRLLQGAGAAFLTANSVAIITDAFPRGELGMALGTNMMAFNVGAIAGYTLGGVMITLFGWRSIFLVNVPVGIFGILWSYKRLKEISKRPVGENFDYAGSILYSAGLLAILGALTLGNPTSPRNLLILAGGFVLFLVFIFAERRQRYPTLDLNLFKIRLFAAGNLAGFLNSVAFNCGPFLRSLYLQLVMGYSALRAGVILIPMEIVVLAVSPISGRLADKYGGRVLSSIGLALNASALFWFSTLNERSTYAAILISLVLFGLGRALFISPNSSSVMGSVPAERRGVANAVRMTLNMTGGVTSVPLSLLLMTLVMPYDRLSQIVSSSQLIGSAELSTFLQAINHACLILGVIILIAIIPSLLRGPRETSDSVRENIPRD